MPTFPDCKEPTLSDHKATPRCPILDLTPASTQYSDANMDTIIAELPVTDTPLPIIQDTLPAPPHVLTSEESHTVNITPPTSVDPVPDTAPTWFTASNATVHASLQAILACLDAQDDHLYSLKKLCTRNKKHPILPVASPAHINDPIPPHSHWGDEPMALADDPYDDENV